MAAAPARTLAGQHGGDGSPDRGPAQAYDLAGFGGPSMLGFMQGGQAQPLPARQGRRSSSWLKSDTAQLMGLEPEQPECEACFWKDEATGEWWVQETKERAASARNMGCPSECSSDSDLQVTRGYCSIM
eukprot:jgi/Astpho2/9883/Aster-06597